jgi:hypothetical protein
LFIVSALSEVSTIEIREIPNYKSKTLQRIKELFAINFRLGTKNSFQMSRRWTEIYQERSQLSARFGPAFGLQQPTLDTQHTMEFQNSIQHNQHGNPDRRRTCANAFTLANKTGLWL